MTNSLNSSNQIPAYSGITINITNPTLNPGSVHHSYPNGCQNNSCNICQSKNLNSTNDTTKSNISVDKNSDIKDSVKDNATNSSNPMSQIGNSYPAELHRDWNPSKTALSSAGPLPPLSSPYKAPAAGWVQTAHPHCHQLQVSSLVYP